MRASLALILAADLAASSASATVMEKADQKAILKVHNNQRGAVGTPDLTWDATLAAHAATWAAHLQQLGTLQHSDNASRPNEGENLWMGRSGGYSATEMAQSWASEKKNFRYGTFPNVSKTGNWGDVGHYTQMVWKSTTKIGCAIAKGPKWDVLVCRYSPPGNFLNQKPY
jgi:uncharacterized protein YkwD